MAVLAEKARDFGRFLDGCAVVPSISAARLGEETPRSRKPGADRCGNDAIPVNPLPYAPRADMLEVAVIGAGQTGKAVAFGLDRFGFRNVRVFDRNPPGLQGPWRSYARNHLLRTRKSETGGLHWGFPNLHFRRWCDAKFGDDYFQGITKIPRLIWAEYLDWIGEVLALPIVYNTNVSGIVWRNDLNCFELDTSRGIERAQFVVMCTGIESAGKQRYPDLVVRNLPEARLFAHDGRSRARPAFLIVMWW